MPKLPPTQNVIFWFRADLRLADNPALFHACSFANNNVIPIFILPPQEDHPRSQSLNYTYGAAQKWWLHHSLISLKQSLKDRGVDLIIRSGEVAAILTEMVAKYQVKHLYWNRVYEPNQLALDTELEKQLADCKIHMYNSSLMFEPFDIMNKQGSFFKVFTPFWKACVAELTADHLKLYDVPKINQQIDLSAEFKVSSGSDDCPSDIKALDLLPSSPDWASKFAMFDWNIGEKGAHKNLTNFIQKKLAKYSTKRDEFGIWVGRSGTSRMSPSLHFGEIGPRQIYVQVVDAKRSQSVAALEADKYLAEIGWREFSYYLLFHFPQLPEKNFQTKFDALRWETDMKILKKWQKGLTGYPVVDAGMRELWASGYMHNRVRMITASLLTKHLLIDWRKGAEWFHYTLLDGDLAANSASWQWVAGCGADAAPYFRIFNPTLQSKKFDPAGDYIRRWVPELKDVSAELIHEPTDAVRAKCGYPKALVEHTYARKRALDLFKNLGDGKKG